MTVEKLIKELQKIDGKKDVYVRNVKGGWLNETKYVKVNDVGDIVIETFKD